MTHVSKATRTTPVGTTCPVCATDHSPALPHDPGSAFYQALFECQAGRLPTWADAMEHCAEDVQEGWKAELRRMGVRV